MLKGFNHLTLAISDLTHSTSFYSELLGFRVAAAWDAGAYLELGELWLCLSIEDSLPVASGYTHYAFSIHQAEFSAFKTKLLAHGVQQWKQNSSEGDSFYFLDPDGHKLEAHVGNLATRLLQCRREPYKGMKFFD